MKLGVDVSKESVDLALQGPSRSRCYQRQVRNDLSGVSRLLEWVKQRVGIEPAQLTVIMEATGVYHEALALALHEAGCRVIVANPKRVRDYAKGVGLLNKTDKVDARALLRYGLEKADELIAWEPPAPEVRALRALYARLEAVKEDLQREINRHQQALIGGQPALVIDSLQHKIERLREECKRLERAIEDHFDQHPDLKDQRELLQTIPSIGPISADHLLCMLLRHRFSSARQAAAFSGLTPRIHESGTSVRKAPHLSKQGDPQLRAKLYMSGLVALRHNAQLKQIYAHLLRAGKSKMSALGALMRRLVHIAFGILKHRTAYNPNLVLANR